MKNPACNIIPVIYERCAGRSFRLPGCACADLQASRTLLPVCVCRKKMKYSAFSGAIIDGGPKCYWGIGLSIGEVLKNALSDTNNAEQNHTLYQEYQELQGKQGAGIAQ